MLFPTATFGIFFAVVFSTYWLLQKSVRGQNLFLIFASYVFYGWWDARFLLLLAASTLTDYLTGLAAAGDSVRVRHFASGAVGAVLLCAVLALFKGADVFPMIGLFAIYLPCLFGFVFAVQRSALPDKRRVFLWTTVAVNLGILGFFKYFNFFQSSLIALVQPLGWHPDFVLLNIILPVGISFYTFQTMSYTIDSYRGTTRPTEDFVQFASFVSFFPQLIAGPIERASHLLPQFSISRRLTAQDVRDGGLLFAWGLYKKIVVADNLAQIADHVFAAPQQASGWSIVVAVLAFGFQIYCDFSGYSDMARGIARVLGFELIANFDLPYFSRTPSEFWRRWHISLSSWLRDYLYVPLGGSRHGEAATYRNLLVTMLLGGLWHGAAWHFVAWGGFHGVTLAAYRRLGIDARLARSAANEFAALLTQCLAWLAMFALVMFGWLLFRANSLGDAAVLISRLAVPGSATPSLATLAFYISPLIAVEVFQRFALAAGRTDWFPLFARFNFYLFVSCSIAFLAAGQVHQFIYFNF